MSKKQRYRSFSKRLTRRIMLALTLALIIVAACFNWIEADVFTRYDKVHCKGALPSQGRSFQPYAFWHGNRIDTMQIARKGNDYLEDDWYRRAFAADSGYCRSPIWTILAGICWFAPPPYPSTTTWDAK